MQKRAMQYFLVVDFKMKKILYGLISLSAVFLFGCEQEAVIGSPPTDEIAVLEQLIIERAANGESTTLQVQELARLERIAKRAEL